MSEHAVPRYGTIDTDYGMQLATTAPDQDGPVWMVNLMKYRDVAEYADGRESSISGSEADDLYSPLDSLTAVGASPVFFGDVDQQLLGDDTVWDRIAVVKYPTRKSFIDMQALPKFKESHKHKDAGMASTIVMGTQPIAQPKAPPGHTQVDWADVPHPPTNDDGPVVVVHVLRFHDAEAAHTTPTNMEQYQTEAAKAAIGHGLRSMGGSQSKEPSSAMAGHGIRCGSTSSQARPRLWRWSSTRTASQLRRTTEKLRSPIPTP